MGLNQKSMYNPQNQLIKILVVDDEIAITEFVKMGLTAEGYEVRVAYDGIEAIKVAREFLPHIMILDLGLPGLSGYEVCQIVKKEIETSIIMLTAREEVDDRVKGLMLGADDYMIKPFNYKELSARIYARIRSAYKSLVDTQVIGRFRIQQSTHEIFFNDEVLELSTTEYGLLLFLLQNQGIVMSKQTILDKVWGYDFYGDDNIIEVYVRYLRQKLGDKNHDIIQTIRGVGYKVNVNG